MNDDHCHTPQGPAHRTAASQPSETTQKPVIVLVGRPNAGKSSLYNRLTGGNAKVGNFPGITVDVLQTEVSLPEVGAVHVVDLPGLYSLQPVTDVDSDEGTARRYIDQVRKSGRPLLVIQVLDASQLALGLRLTHELVKEDFALAIVATQYDLLKTEDKSIDIQALSEALSAPVLAVSAREEKAKDSVFSLAVELLTHSKYSLSDRHQKAKLWNPDQLTAKVLQQSQSQKPPPGLQERTAKIDRWLLHPLLGPVIFLGLMTLLFSCVFLVADPVTTLLDKLIQTIGGLVEKLLGQGRISSFIVDGLLGGAGTVLAFLPQIVVLTASMEILEATGYLSRGAFLVDRILHAFGMTGRSFVPLLTAHACAVPAIAATRILRDGRDRLSTILVLPLMACSARIPTYSLLISAFFSHRSPVFRAMIFVLLYLFGILSGLIVSLVIRKVVVRGRSLPLVLEMPYYRRPQWSAIFQATRRAATRFVKDVGTTILVASAVLWVLLSLSLPFVKHPPAHTRSEQIQHSIAASLGRSIEPVTSLAGFDWRINVGLFGSFGARELMVGTLGVIFGLENAGEEPAPLVERLQTTRLANGKPAYTTRTGLSLMVFFILACQCMSTLAAIRRETQSWRWPLFVAGYTYALAYISSVITYQSCGLFGIS